MNIPKYDNTKGQVDQQSIEQTVLLNAIKNKFANNESHSGTSPPVFSIPTLKFPQLSAAANPLDNNEKVPSKLNQFILSKLGENKSLTSTGSFEIPNLQLLDKESSASLTLAQKLGMNRMTPSESNIISLNKGISDLHLRDERKTHIIDLTSALNQHSTITASPIKELTINTPNHNDFQIPFIDCDLKEETVHLPLRDEYCQTDVSSFVYTKFSRAPSRFGKITCLRYRLPRHSLRVDHSFRAKHKINRFAFDTKSPDDNILASLRKFNRVTLT